MTDLMKNRFSKPKYSGGYAVIFSVVVISVVVVVTLATSSLVQKELELSSIGQQSMEAFFAADAGIECALYWDISRRDYHNAFGRNDGGAVSGIRNISCEGRTVTPTETGSGVYEFAIEPSGVDYWYEVTLTVDGTDTTVKSNGYNTRTPGSGRVERGLEVRY